MAPYKYLETKLDEPLIGDRDEGYVLYCTVVYCICTFI